MGRAKNQFIRETGGYRLGETEEAFLIRVKEIRQLEKEFKSGVYHGDDLERVQRRLCELKGISFDQDDEDEDL